MEIQFTIRERDANEEYEQYLAMRLCRILHSDPNAEPIEKPSGYRWDLCANDWHMSREGNVVKFQYRYGHGHTDMFHGLARFLLFTLGLEALNPDLVSLDDRHRDPLQREQQREESR